MFREWTYGVDQKYGKTDGAANTSTLHPRETHKPGHGFRVVLPHSCLCHVTCAALLPQRHSWEWHLPHLQISAHPTTLGRDASGGGMVTREPFGDAMLDQHSWAQCPWFPALAVLSTWPRFRHQLPDCPPPRSSSDGSARSCSTWIPLHTQNLSRPLRSWAHASALLPTPLPSRPLPPVNQET
uniref:Uncharacterized protein n=1 Tax=Rangifer tarandus platyrhynchus TaxID=3082113 RepID=A0ACB0FF11_RANTA|nr:unnamed protein product [Rangifer tarandus platyrhynchus]